MTSKISGYNATPALAPLKGPSPGAVADKAQPDASAPAGTTAGSKAADQLTLTSSARSLQSIEKAISNAPVVNASKVASVKQSIRSGTHQIDSGRIADKILQFEGNLK